MARFLTTAVILCCFNLATPEVTDYDYHVDDGHHDDDPGHGVQTVVRAGGPTAFPQPISSCQTRSIDLVFLIDANGHQSKRNYDKMMDAANEIAFDNIDVSSGFGINQKPTVRLSFVVYGEVSSNSFDYATSTTFGINEVLEAQDQTLLGPYYHTVKSKHLLNALSYINGNIFNQVKPKEATPVLVIFHSQTSDRINRAIRLLDKNEVQIFAIGLNDKFGNEANANQLSFMAENTNYDLGAMKDYGLQYTDYFYSKQSSRQKRSHLATNPQQGQSSTKRTLRLISRKICEASKMVLGGKSLTESTNSSTELTIDPTVPVKQPCFVQTYLSPQIMTNTEYNQRVIENGFSPKIPKNKESNRHQNVWENALDYPITIFKIAHSKESELTEIKAGSTRYAKPKPMRKKKKQRNNDSGDAESESETEIFMREGESIIIKACEAGSCDTDSVVILAYVEPVDSYFMKLDGKKVEFFRENCDNQADPSVADCKDWYQQAMQIEGMTLDENHICYDIMPEQPVEETTMPVPQAEKESCGQYCQNNFDQLVYWSKDDEPVVCEIDDDYTNHYENYADHNESDTTMATYDRSLPNIISKETDENQWTQLELDQLPNEDGKVWTQIELDMLPDQERLKVEKEIAEREAKRKAE